MYISGNYINFLEETKDCMEKAHESPEDVEFVGSRDRKIKIGGWDEFKALADFTYNDGFGSESVADDLIIAFKDGSVMFRETYDGSEWWSFISGAGHKNEHGPLTMNEPRVMTTPLSYSLKSMYKDQVKKEAKADVDEKMKELEES